MEEIRIMEAGPKGFRGALLDELLAKGYFRDGRKMVAKDSQQDGYYGRSPMFYWVCMLRYPVADYSPSATIRNIRNRCAKFELTHKGLSLRKRRSSTAVTVNSWASSCQDPSRSTYTTVRSSPLSTPRS